MKISLYILFILAALVLGAVGCNRNNGDIGAWFGTWQLVSITDLSGELIPMGNTVIVKFQNDIIQTTRQFGHYDSEEYYANWRESGKKLVIDGVGKSIAPELRLPGNSVVELEIVRRPGTVMVWKYVDAEGNGYEYNLKRLY